MTLQESTIYRGGQKFSPKTDGPGLGDACGATPVRVKTQDGGKSILEMVAGMWICLSERPLHAGELCRTLVVEPGSTDFNVGSFLPCRYC